jgi:hypothetical protein
MHIFRRKFWAFHNGTATKHLETVAEKIKDDNKVIVVATIEESNKSDSAVAQQAAAATATPNNHQTLQRAVPAVSLVALTLVQAARRFELWADSKWNIPGKDTWYCLRLFGGRDTHCYHTTFILSA